MVVLVLQSPSAIFPQNLSADVVVGFVAFVTVVVIVVVVVGGTIVVIAVVEDVLHGNFEHDELQAWLEPHSLTCNELIVT
jgi:hypothetical protein